MKTQGFSLTWVMAMKLKKYQFDESFWGDEVFQDKENSTTIMRCFQEVQLYYILISLIFMFEIVYLKIHSY